MVEMRVIGFHRCVRAETPVLVLRALDGTWVISFHVCPVSAALISLELGQAEKNPTIYEVVRQICLAADTDLCGVVLDVTPDDQSVRARLLLEPPAGSKQFECALADGVALALRFQRPIVCTLGLLERWGHRQGPGEEEGLHRWLERVTPQDFTS